MPDLLGRSKEKTSKSKVTSAVKHIPDTALSSLLLPLCSRQVWEAPSLNFYPCFWLWLPLPGSNQPIRSKSGQFFLMQRQRTVPQWDAGLSRSVATSAKQHGVCNQDFGLAFIW